MRANPLTVKPGRMATLHRSNPEDPGDDGAKVSCPDANQPPPPGAPRGRYRQGGEGVVFQINSLPGPLKIIFNYKPNYRVASRADAQWSPVKVEQGRSTHCYSAESMTPTVVAGSE